MKQRLLLATLLVIGGFFLRSWSWVGLYALWFGDPKAMAQTPDYVSVGAWISPFSRLIDFVPCLVAFVIVQQEAYKGTLRKISNTFHEYFAVFMSVLLLADICSELTLCAKAFGATMSIEYSLSHYVISPVVLGLEVVTLALAYFVFDGWSVDRRSLCADPARVRRAQVRSIVLSVAAFWLGLCGSIVIFSAFKFRFNWVAIAAILLVALLMLFQAHRDYWFAREEIKSAQFARQTDLTELDEETIFGRLGAGMDMPQTQESQGLMPLKIGSLVMILVYFGSVELFSSALFNQAYATDLKPGQGIFDSTTVEWWLRLGIIDLLAPIVTGFTAFWFVSKLVSHASESAGGQTQE